MQNVMQMYKEVRINLNTNIYHCIFQFDHVAYIYSIIRMK